MLGENQDTLNNMVNAATLMLCPLSPEGTDIGTEVF